MAEKRIDLSRIRPKKLCITNRAVSRKGELLFHNGSMPCDMPMQKRKDNQELLLFADTEKLLTSDLPIDNAYNRLSVNYSKRRSAPEKGIIIWSTREDVPVFT